MYCQGLGDCFLLTFPPKSGTRPVRVLIDCGVLQKTPAEREKMRAVAESLRRDTRDAKHPNGHIDLLVVTHEHWDHVAGFSHARDIFGKMTFDHVWLSWAENPDDPAARAVKAELGKKKARLQAALTAARARLGARGRDPATDRLLDDLDATDGVVAFFGPAAAAAAAPKKGAKAPAPGPRMTLGETMDWLRGKVRPGDFRAPGERRPLPGAADVNVYVLGPPKDVAGIRKMNPTGDQGYRHLSDRVSLLGALDWLTDDTKTGDPPGPFDARYGVRVADAAADPFFREFYGFPDDPLGDDGTSWRRIDDEWLVGGVGRLALQLDTGVNNTSLALAFELPDGRTMIFPGDAQIGNWLSWDEVAFTDGAGRELPVTAADLLGRAVFYKVGHHGSHNATRKKGGLEAMVSGDLVAMIPTDEAFALGQKPHPWKMPFPDLNDALLSFTHHRILRADRGKADLAAAGRKASAARWEEFAGRVRFPTQKMVGDDGKKGTRPLYVEYTVPL
jgi:hypothetical protein